MSYDPERVAPDAMLEAIESNTGFTPTVARSRVEHAHAANPPEIASLVQKAIDEAAASNRRVFIDFHASWCGACRIMEQTTFADSAVRKALAADYVFLKIDTDEHPTIGKQFDVVGLPTIVTLDSTGEVIYRHTGPMSAEELLGQLVAMSQEERLEP